ncbi:MAG: hypothetical protein ACXVP5_06120 [Tumebacillaceae bacterium]
MLRAFLDWMMGEEQHDTESFEKRARVASELPAYVPQCEYMVLVCQDILSTRG